MKKIGLMMLIILLVLSLAACTGSNTEPEPEPTEPFVLSNFTGDFLEGGTYEYTLTVKLGTATGFGDIEDAEVVVGEALLPYVTSNTLTTKNLNEFYAISGILELNLDISTLSHEEQEALLPYIEKVILKLAGGKEEVIVVAEAEDVEDSQEDTTQQDGDDAQSDDAQGDDTQQDGTDDTTE